MYKRAFRESRKLGSGAQERVRGLPARRHFATNKKPPGKDSLMKAMRTLFFLFAPFALFGLSLCQAAQSSTSAPTAKQLESKSFKLDGGKVWTDTGMILEPGQRVVFAAEGNLRYSDAKA